MSSFLCKMFVILALQFVPIHSAFDLVAFFRQFNDLQHLNDCEKQQQLEQQQQQNENEDNDSGEILFTNIFDLFIGREREMQNYRATVSPPGRYIVIAWSDFTNADECQQKFVRSSAAAEPSLFTLNALNESQHLLEKCFKHFHMAKSDANGQFELKHNFFDENLNEKSGGTGGSDVFSNLSAGGEDCSCWQRNKQKSKMPNKIVHLQIMPADEQLKPIPCPNDNNMAAQIKRDIKVKHLCNNNTNEAKQKNQQKFTRSLSLTKRKELIEYHEESKRAIIINEILNNWTNSFGGFAHENAFFLVAYLRLIIYEVESCNKVGKVDFILKYALFSSAKDKFNKLVSNYGDALIVAFEKMTILSILDSNLIAEMIGMINRMCSIVRQYNLTQQEATNIYKSWHNFCMQFDFEYKKLTKHRNKNVLALLDQCLLGEDPNILIDRQAIYYVEHLIFQVERIVADPKATFSQMNEKDQKLLAQIGQFISVASANKIGGQQQQNSYLEEESANKIGEKKKQKSYFEEKKQSLGQMGVLFGRLCKNWKEFEKKITNKTKFETWTRLCELNVFDDVEI